MISFAESSIEHSKHQENKNDSKQLSILSNNESIKEFIQSANTKGMAKFVQPSDSIEFINTVESSKSDEYILIESKHTGEKKTGKHVKKEIPQAIVDLKPDLVPPEGTDSNFYLSFVNLDNF